MTPAEIILLNGLARRWMKEKANESRRSKYYFRDGQYQLGQRHYMIADALNHCAEELRHFIARFKNADWNPK